MGSTFTCVKNGFTLTAQLPEAGERILRGCLNFPEAALSSEATVELGMISRKHRAFPMPEPWTCEREAPETRATLKPDSQNKADFELKIPPWMRPFKGAWLEIAMVVLVRAAKGTTIRLVMEGAEPPGGIRYVLSGLPAQRRIKAPLAPWFFGIFLAATLTLVVLGFRLSNPELHKAAFAGGVLAFCLSFFAIPRTFRWIRLGSLSLKAETLREGAQTTIRVSGRGERVTGAGHVRLVAREFIYSNSSLSKFDPIATAQIPLRSTAGGDFEARLPWPSPEQAPPSLCLSRAQTQHGILWELVFELESRRGGKGEAEIGLRVAAEEGQD